MSVIVYVIVAAVSAVSGGALTALFAKKLAAKVSAEEAAVKAVVADVKKAV
jgi:hypothetical protein